MALNYYFGYDREMEESVGEQPDYAPRFWWKQSLDVYNASYA